MNDAKTCAGRGVKYGKAALVAVLLAMAMLGACAAPLQTKTVGEGAARTPQPAVEPDSATGAPSSVALTDMAGRRIALDAPASRVVVLTAGDCEILYAIGAGDTVIGRGEYCDYPAETASAPAVQSGSETNVEQILALHPDVVVLSTMAQTSEQMDALEKAGVSTVATSAQDIEGTYTAIELLGALTGHEAEAAALCKGMRNTFATLAERARSLGDTAQRQTVYFEISPLAYGLWTAGSGTFMDEIAEILNLENAFSDISGWSEISQEQVLSRNPDYMVTVAMYSGEGPTPVEEIRQRAGWQDMAAVQRGAVFAADSDAMARPGPRLADAAQALFDFVYASNGRG